MTIQLAVIGCGQHALRSHIIPGMAMGFEVVAVYDPNQESIAKLREETGFSPVQYDSHVQMVSRTDIQAVLIASPDQTHPRQLLDVVAAEKPVLCEKPLAISPEGLALVDRAMRLADTSETPIMSCHPRRETADLPYGWVKCALEDMKSHFGALQHIELDFSYPKPSKSWKEDRSLLLDHFPHEIDFLLWLLGKTPFEARRITDRHDAYCVAGMFQGNTTFICHGTRRLNSSTYPETIRLRFSRGDYLINTKTGVVTSRNHETEHQKTIYIQPTDYDARSRIVMSDFAEAVETRSSPVPTAHLWTVNEASVMLAHAGHYRTSV